MLAATMAFAQQDNLFQELRTALSSAGFGEAVSAALAKHDFEMVERLLTGLNPATRAERSEVLALRGGVQFVEGKMNPAARNFQEASELAPLKDAASFTFAMALVRLEDEAHARRLLIDLADKYPARAIYVYWLGRLDYSRRRYEKAVEELTRAAELDPQSPRIWDSMGLAFDMQGRMDQALAAFQKAASLNRVLAHPSPWPPHDLGFLLLRMDEAKQAEASLREALRYSPPMPQAHYHLGRALEKQARDTEALEEYRNAIAADTAFADPCYALAMLDRKLHRGPEAMAMFTEFRKRKQARSEAATAER
jgi:tetratricopeptide (TPR) repeat protein